MSLAPVLPPGRRQSPQIKDASLRGDNVPHIGGASASGLRPLTNRAKRSKAYICF